MPNHNLEEVFRRIAHARRRGIPNPPTITAGVSANVTGGGASGASGATGGAGSAATSGGTQDLTTSLAGAANEIAQLRVGYQQQADLIKANTQAVQSNTAGQGSHSVASGVGSALSGLLQGATSLLAPIISGIKSLFGGGGTTPVTLPIYTQPSPVSIGGILHSGDGVANSPAVGSAPNPSSAAIGYTPQVSYTGPVLQGLQDGTSAPLTPTPATVGYKPQISSSGSAVQSAQSESSAPDGTFAPPAPTTPTVGYAPQISYASAALQSPQAGVSSPVGQSQQPSTPKQVQGADDSTARSTSAQNQPSAASTAYSPQITVHVSAMDSQSFMDRSADIASAVREAMLNNHPINGVVADL